MKEVISLKMWIEWIEKMKHIKYQEEELDTFCGRSGMGTLCISSCGMSINVNESYLDILLKIQRILQVVVMIWSTKVIPSRVKDFRP